MLRVDEERALLDFVQPGCLEELRKVALARTRKPRLVLDVAIELVRRLPERANRSSAAGVIPDAFRGRSRPASLLP